MHTCQYKRKHSPDVTSQDASCIPVQLKPKRILTYFIPSRQNYNLLNTRASEKHKPSVLQEIPLYGQLHGEWGHRARILVCCWSNCTATGCNSLFA